jgi:hypothetical protein
MNKLLRNRFVVAGLVVVALGTVFFSVRKDLRRALGPRWAGTRKPVANAPVESRPMKVIGGAPVAVAATPAAVVAPEKPLGPPTIKRELARSRVTRWVDAPERDPFALFASVATVKATPKKAVALVVSGIWRQSGQQLAVLNGRLVKEGDQAFDYTVERIESGAVFLRSAANGVARAEFPAFTQFTHTNRVAAAASRTVEADRRKTVEPGG